MKTFLEKSQRFPVSNKNFLSTQISVGGTAVRHSNGSSLLPDALGEVCVFG